MIQDFLTKHGIVQFRQSLYSPDIFRVTSDYFLSPKNPELGEMNEQVHHIKYDARIFDAHTTVHCYRTAVESCHLIGVSLNTECLFFIIGCSRIKISNAFETDLI